MKKLGRFDSDPPSVEGSGGVSADGDTAFELEPAPVFAPFFGLLEGCVGFVLRWLWGTVVRGCELCARTSGAGTVVVASLPVLVPVVLVPTDGASPALGTVVPVLVDGSGSAGAGTFVVVVAAGTEVSVA
jgi:hypothetical protein